MESLVKERRFSIEEDAFGGTRGHSGRERATRGTRPLLSPGVRAVRASLSSVSVPLNPLPFKSRVYSRRLSSLAAKIRPTMISQGEKAGHFLSRTKQDAHAQVPLHKLDQRPSTTDKQQGEPTRE